MDAKEQYDLLLDNKDNLFSQLRELLKQLYYNSEYVVGQESSAGVGIYVALARFVDYYKQCSNAQIPTTVRQEIELLYSIRVKSSHNK